MEAFSSQGLEVYSFTLVSGMGGFRKDSEYTP